MNKFSNDRERKSSKPQFLYLAKWGFFSFVPAVVLISHYFYLLEHRPQTYDPVNGFTHSYPVRGIDYFLSQTDILLLIGNFIWLVIALVIAQIAMFRHLRRP